MKVFTIPLPPLMTNCYVVYEREGGRCFIIDPASSPDTIVEIIDRMKLKPKAVLLTHGHFDHIGGADALRERYGIPLYLHEGDLDMITKPEMNCSASFMGGNVMLKEADKALRDGDAVTLEKEFLRVLHTPGHSEGSCVYLGDGIMFSGDTLFCNGYGRCDLYGGNYGALMESIQGLMRLDSRTRVYPGHGEPTTIGDEMDLYI